METARFRTRPRVKRNVSFSTQRGVKALETGFTGLEPCSGRLRTARGAGDKAVDAVDRRGANLPAPITQRRQATETWPFFACEARRRARGSAPRSSPGGAR